MSSVNDEFDFSILGAALVTEARGVARTHDNPTLALAMLDGAHALEPALKELSGRRELDPAPVRKVAEVLRHVVTIRDVAVANDIKSVADLAGPLGMLIDSVVARRRESWPVLQGKTLALARAFMDVDGCHSFARGLMESAALDGNEHGDRVAKAFHSVRNTAMTTHVPREMKQQVEELHRSWMWFVAHLPDGELCQRAKPGPKVTFDTKKEVWARVRGLADAATKLLDSATGDVWKSLSKSEVDWPAEPLTTQSDDPVLRFIEEQAQMLGYTILVVPEMRTVVFRRIVK